MVFRKTALCSAHVRKFGRSRQGAAPPSFKRKLELRPPSVPRFWRRTDNGRPPPDGRTLELWSLACQALRIPCRLAGKGEAARLYVPCLYEVRVRRELAELSAEGTHLPASSPGRDNAYRVLACLAALLIWHGIAADWWRFPGLASRDWSSLGALDVYKVRAAGEWYRCVTALTLHADSRHLFGNLLFGAPFLILLCRRIGVGAGLLLTLGGGALGNVFNTLYRTPSHLSLGFSTALFATVGSLAALAAAERTPVPTAPFRSGTGSTGAMRRAGLPLAAGAGVLAMLGTEGERTDYAAHVLGLFAGLLLGGLAGRFVFRKGPLSRTAEIAAGCAAWVTVVLCWRQALP